MSKTIEVKRAGTGRPATQEELNAAVGGRPLPPPEAAVDVQDLLNAYRTIGRLQRRERALGRRGNAQQCADIRLLIIEAVKEIDGVDAVDTGE